MKRLYVRYSRYLYFIIVCFVERIQGLDFTMRDQRLLKETNNKLHGYAITPKKHLDEIFSCLSLEETDKFIDIGCGKGYVLWYASKYSFSEIMGIDIDERLIRIAHKNMERLKLHNVRLLCEDATKFSSYATYGVYYLANPFGAEITRQVIDCIIQTMDGRKIVIIYYNPTYADYIESTKKFALKHRLHCKTKDYFTNIYENV